jgi:AbiV family abortive infection protein
VRIRDPFNLVDPEQRTAAEDLMERFQGHLSVAQIAEGIGMCLRNAQELYQDATVLSASARWARALSLLVAAMEEIGKISVLCAMARIPKKNQKLWPEVWAQFRSHEEKSSWAFVHTYSDEARAEPNRLLLAAAHQRALAGLCERIRQFGLYVDFHVVEKRWLSPTEVTQGDVAEWSQRVEICLSRCEVIRSLGLYSPRALEIQAEVYASLNGDRPRRRDLTPDYLGDFMLRAPEIARVYFDRLVQEGIIPADSDFTVVGQPIGCSKSQDA